LPTDGNFRTLVQEKTMIRFVAAGVVLIGFVSAAFGGKYNAVLNPGDAAPAWTDLEGVDGRRHSLADLADRQVVVVVFTCNSCPIATDYEDRIIAIAKKFTAPGGKVALVAINVNTIDEDQLPKMRERAEAKGFSFPYLYDPTQQIGKAFGAAFTPEFFVLDRQRKVIFMGGMDDSSQVADVKNKFLEPAIEAALADKPPKVAEAPAIGCRVRYERQRRGKVEK
jgi:peroxiredoxin